MKISFTTDLRTKKFSSVNELPPDLRDIYERALANGPGKLTSNGPRISTRLVVNGQEVERTEKILEAEQKLYGDVLQLLQGAKVTTADRSSKAPAESAASVMSGQAPGETGWLTTKQWKLVVIMIVLAALSVALLLARDLIAP